MKLTENIEWTNLNLHQIVYNSINNSKRYEIFKNTQFKEKN